MRSKKSKPRRRTSRRAEHDRYRWPTCSVVRWKPESKIYKFEKSEWFLLAYIFSPKTNDKAKTQTNRLHSHYSTRKPFHISCLSFRAPHWRLDVYTLSSSGYEALLSYIREKSSLQMQFCGALQIRNGSVYWVSSYISVFKLFFLMIFEYRCARFVRRVSVEQKTVEDHLNAGRTAFNKNVSWARKKL